MDAQGDLGTRSRGTARDAVRGYGIGGPWGPYWHTRGRQMVGTDAAAGDTMAALSGRDTVDARGGDDLVFGGSGDDGGMDGPAL